jgi:hypothetical protein
MAPPESSRQATAMAYRHLGYTPPDGNGAQRELL